jgi:hypothetical protein
MRSTVFNWSNNIAWIFDGENVVCAFMRILKLNLNHGCLAKFYKYELSEDHLN